MSVTKVLYKESESAYHGQIFLSDVGYDNTLFNLKNPFVDNSLFFKAKWNCVVLDYRSALTLAGTCVGKRRREWHTPLYQSLSYVKGTGTSCCRLCYLYRKLFSYLLRKENNHSFTFSSVWVGVKLGLKKRLVNTPLKRDLDKRRLQR